MGHQDPHQVPVSEVRAAVLAETKAKIAACGWTVIAVFPTAQDQGPSFAYTVGLSAQSLPELAIYGLPGPVAHSLLNEVARRIVAAGQGLATGDRIEGVLVDDVALVAVEMTDARDLNLVRECYGAVAAAVQLVWPDADGVLPWEQGSRVGGAEQPLRGRPPQARPVYHAQRLAVSTAQELADLLAEQPRRSLLAGDGSDPQRDNDVRAGWAGRALVAYAQHLGGSSLTEDAATAATDLLSDLRHLFDALGVDWEQAVASAEGYYRDEIFGQL